MASRSLPRDLTVRSIGVCLILGLIAALGVAGAAGWFLAYRIEPTSYKAELANRPKSRHVTREVGLGTTYYQEFEWLPNSGVEPRPAREIRDAFHSANWVETTPESFGWSIGGPDGSATMVEWGWPCRCVWGAMESHWRTKRESSLGLYVYFKQIDPSTTFTALLPYFPIPMGLALDTLVWAMPWWLGLFGVRSLRRHLRLRRNHCPACDYDLRATPASSPCPECGRS
jgi:hypothetical protein